MVSFLLSFTLFAVAAKTPELRHSRALASHYTRERNPSNLLKMIDLMIATDQNLNACFFADLALALIVDNPRHLAHLLRSIGSLDECKVIAHRVARLIVNFSLSNVLSEDSIQALTRFYDHEKLYDLAHFYDKDFLSSREGSEESKSVLATLNNVLTGADSRIPNTSNVKHYKLESDKVKIIAVLYGIALSKATPDNLNTLRQQTNAIYALSEINPEDVLPLFIHVSKNDNFDLARYAIQYIPKILVSSLKVRETLETLALDPNLNFKTRARAAEELFKFGYIPVAELITKMKDANDVDISKLLDLSIAYGKGKGIVCRWLINLSDML